MPKYFLKDVVRPPFAIWLLAYSISPIYGKNSLKRNVLKYKPWCKYVLARKK